MRRLNPAEGLLDLQSLSCYSPALKRVVAHLLNDSISPLLLYLFFFFFQDSKSEGDSKARKVLGHTFTKEEERGKKLSCDKCGKTIWMWQSLFTCNGTD